jgi:Tfp pilus assembly protein PilP
VFADNHDKDNSSKESKEEPLPLNDPFVGDSSFSGGVKVITDEENSIAEKKMIDLYKFKLVGIIKSDQSSFVSMINQDGEVITVGMFEELNDGVKLVDMTTKEAIFQTEEKYLIMNFKNQIKETSEY